MTISAYAHLDQLKLNELLQDNFELQGGEKTFLKRTIVTLEQQINVALPEIPKVLRYKPKKKTMFNWFLHKEITTSCLRPVEK